ncbi:hypothetical protein Q4R10_20855, partial [Morganella morganii]
ENNNNYFSNIPYAPLYSGAFFCLSASISRIARLSKISTYRDKSGLRSLPIQALRMRGQG